jgi:hypothetical protein
MKKLRGNRRWGSRFAVFFLVLAISTFAVGRDAFAGDMKIKVDGTTITIIASQVAPPDLPASFTDANGKVFNLGNVPAGADPSFILPAKTTLVGGKLTLGPKTPGAGTFTTPPLSKGTETYRSLEEAAKKVGMGNGTAPGSLVSVPAAIPFSPSSLTQTIQPPTGSAVTLPTPSSISGVIDLTSTSDPNVFDVQFASFQAEYSAFSVPTLGLTGLTTEILDPTATVSGTLDLTDDTLQVPLPADWYDASGDLLTTSYEMLTLNLTQDAITPDLLDYSFTESGDFGVVPYSAIDEPTALLSTPEPGSWLLLATACAGLWRVTARAGWRRNCGSKGIALSSRRGG